MRTARRHALVLLCGVLGAAACTRPVGTQLVPPKPNLPSEPPRPLEFAQLAPVHAPPLQTQLSSEEIRKACADAEVPTEARLAAVLAVRPTDRTFANTVKAYEEALAEHADVTGRLSFLKDIHPESGVRNAARLCEERSHGYRVRVHARKPLYDAVKGYADGHGRTDVLDPVDHKLLELTLLEFQRAGLGLSEADRATLVSLRSRIAALETRFSANLDENLDSVEATGDELQGVPRAVVDRLKRTHAGRFIVTTKYPDYFPVMENARSEALRQRLWVAFHSRDADRNLPLLAEAIRLRAHAATLLGYATHVDFVTADGMAKNPKAVTDFLGRIHAQLAPGRAALDAEMRMGKAKDTRVRRATLQIWDVPYLLKQIKRRDHAVDDELVRSYFPADRVLDGMFRVYATVLGVEIRELAGAPAWAPGVKLYEVHDAGEGRRMLAKFYLDPYPRNGKFGHAASFGLSAGRAVPEGYQIPLTALVVNFTPPEGGHPAFLSLAEVAILFHEFGHVMHASLDTARYVTLGAGNVPIDFIEAPSQMFENWVYQPEVLALISRDPAHPEAPMPAELARKIVAARTFDAGYVYTRQDMLATIDFVLHTSGDAVDPDAAEHQIRAQFDPYPAPPEHFVASFGHLMGGYDGGFYGYLWSKVFAADLFTRFQTEGVLSPAVGKALRDTVLGKGRTQEPEVLLEAFLGRPSNDAAFLKQLNLAPSK